MLASFSLFTCVSFGPFLYQRKGRKQKKAALGVLVRGRFACCLFPFSLVFLLILFFTKEKDGSKRKRHWGFLCEGGCLLSLSLFTCVSFGPFLYQRKGRKGVILTPLPVFSHFARLQGLLAGTVPPRRLEHAIFPTKSVPCQFIQRREGFHRLQIRPAHRVTRIKYAHRIKLPVIQQDMAIGQK